MKDEHMHEQGSQQTQLSAEPMHVTPQKKSLRNFTSFLLSLPDNHTGEKTHTIVTDSCRTSTIFEWL